MSDISIYFFNYLAPNIAASFITFAKSAPDIPKHLFATSSNFTSAESFFSFECTSSILILPF
jgi:hypothetical protein